MLFVCSQVCVCEQASATQTIPYARLLESLDLPSVRVMEDLIIDGIYANVFSGRLDQKSQMLEIESAIGRDMRPGELEAVIAKLQDWCVWSVPIVVVCLSSVAG